MASINIFRGNVCWRMVQDFIGNGRNWPRYMARLWFCSNLGNHDRVTIAAFAYGNGCGVDLLCDCLISVNRYVTRLKINKIRYLYTYWDDPQFGFERRSVRNYYDMVLGVVVNLNGGQRKHTIVYKK